MLRAMDLVFRSQVVTCKGAQWSFASFPVISGHNIIKDCCDHYYGIYVLKCMQATYNRDRIYSHGTGDEERLCVVIQLLMLDPNKLCKHVMSECIRSQVVSSSSMEWN